MRENELIEKFIYYSSQPNPMALHSESFVMDAEKRIPKIPQSNSFTKVFLKGKQINNQNPS